MDIQEFIKETLTQIANSANEVNKALESIGAFVPSKCVNGDNIVVRTDETMPKNVVMVDFDIAVTASEGKSTSGGGSLHIASVVNAGMGKGSNSETQQTHRIKFSMPLVLPDDKHRIEKQRGANVHYGSI